MKPARRPTALALAAALLLAAATAAAGETVQQIFVDRYRRLYKGSGGGASPASTEVTEGCAAKEILQPLDHFGRPGLPGAGTLKERYYVCDFGHGNYSGSQPVYFGLGGEGEVGDPTADLYFEMARAERGLYIVAEHRFYGKSLPAAPVVSSAKYLTVEQALADYARVVRIVRANYKVPAKAPTVCYGGSYAGALTAWMRVTYPDVCAIGVASSAPVKGVLGTHSFEHIQTDPYSRVMSRAVLKLGGKVCFDRMRLAFDTLQGPMSQTTSGRQALANAVKGSVCSDDGSWKYLVEDPKQLPGVALTIRLAWWSVLQYKEYIDTNRDNSVDLADGKAMVRALCQPLTGPASPTPLDLVKALAASGLEAEKLDAERKKKIDADATVPSCLSPFVEFDEPSKPETSWSDTIAYQYQSCNQGMPWSDFYSAGGIWGRYSYPVRSHTASCAVRFNGVRMCPPARYNYRPDLFTRFGNILFVNGEVDPWAGASVTASLSRRVPAVILPSAGHCADLWPNTGDDAVTLIQDRVIKPTIKKWVAEHGGRGYFNY